MTAEDAEFIKDCEAKGFALGSKAFDVCITMVSSSYIPKAEVDALVLQLDSAQQELSLLEKENSGLAGTINERIMDLGEKTEELDAANLKLKDIQADFGLYRWQNRMKVIVPMMLGSIAALEGDGVDEQAVYFFAGAGFGFTIEYLDIGLSKYAGELAYRLTLKKAFLKNAVSEFDSIY